MNHLNKVLELQKDYQTKHGLRKGQSLFNAVAIIYPSIAEDIRNTDYDPYYKDCNIDKCLEYLKQKINN